MNILYLILPAFHGKLLRSVYRTNTYLNYFKVAEFVRYNGEYGNPILAHQAGACPIVTTTTTTNSSIELNGTEEEEEEEQGGVLDLLESIEQEVPQTGTVRVIAKCPMRLNKTYFVSARLHTARSGRPRLIMCCQHSDEHFTKAHLTHLLHRQECCRHIQ